MVKTVDESELKAKDKYTVFPTCALNETSPKGVVEFSAVGGEMKELENLDREQLLENFRSRLPAVREELGLSPEDMEIRTSIGAKRIKAIEEGRQKLKWSEYLSIVFVLWSSETGRTILEEKELFPEELRRAMSVNRNAHD